MLGEAKSSWSRADVEVLLQKLSKLTKRLLLGLLLGLVAPPDLMLAGDAINNAA